MIRRPPRSTRTDTRFPYTTRVRSHADIRVPELVVMELLVGAVDDRAARSLRRLLHSFEVVPLAPIVDSERAAALQRQCRRAGRPIRSMIDCLVGALAVRLGQPVLHTDLDFRSATRSVGKERVSTCRAR